MHHGYWAYCSGGECKVCNTPWPELFTCPTLQYLKNQKYFEKNRKVYFASNQGDGLEYVGGVFKGGELELPTGMPGEELLQIRKQLNDEYKQLEGKTGGLEECIKRGALEGHVMDKK